MGRQKPPPAVKVCGLTRRQDALFAAEAGAAYLGVVLVPGTPRALSVAEARALLDGIGVRKVVVMVNPTVDEALHAAATVGADVIQLHGEETPEFMGRLGARGPWEIWKALRVSGASAVLEGLDRFGSAAQGILLDGWHPRDRGGSGTAFSWEEVEGIRGLFPAGLRLIAAGGLNPENVHEAILRLAPHVVDVSSGVEAGPGIKDSGKIQALHSKFEENRHRRGKVKVESMDSRGRFGVYGGRYVPETLITALDELEAAYVRARADADFWSELEALLKDFVGRPTPLYRARRLEAEMETGPIYLKREDLNHTGAHKINNTLGQVLLARRMGKTRIIAETGAGQHGVATATACALFGLECIVYMGEEDVARQALNVYRMQIMGAEVRTVTSGTRTLKDATNEAIRDWVTTVGDTHYIIGSVVGPSPFPAMVRDFQSVIGREAREQILEMTGRLPGTVVACVGGGSNAMGIFHAFIEDPEVALIGVEAAGLGIDTGRHAASLTDGKPGVLHGSLSYLLQDDDGQVAPAHSISAGLDYPGVGPEHSHLKDTGRATYVSVTDAGALEAFHLLSRTEGIIPALETAHAIAYLRHLGSETQAASPILVCLSGRGDKDVAHVARVEGTQLTL